MPITTLAGVGTLGTVGSLGILGALAAKAVLAVMLLVAGGAKLADRPGFAATVRLFAPRRLAGSASSARLLRGVALAVALGELALGAASLTSPAVGWLNPVVLVAGCAFVAVSGLGYRFHRGRSCRCWGALSQRKFDRGAIGRALAVAALAGLAMVAAPASSTRLGAADRGLLLAAAGLITFVAFTAARALAASREALSGMVA